MKDHDDQLERIEQLLKFQCIQLHNLTTAVIALSVPPGASPSLGDVASRATLASQQALEDVFHRLSELKDAQKAKQAAEELDALLKSLAKNPRGRA